MNLAIIPARSGSKRIINKNIKIFEGKPIICYSILAAKSSGIFDKIVVSTDSKKIASISKKYGADVPFLRSKKLSKDKIGIIEVISQTLKKLEIKPNLSIKVCCIYPTAPMLKKEFLKRGYKKLTKNYDYVLSVKKEDSRILRGFYGYKEKIIPIDKKIKNTRSQNLKNIYVDSGQFCWGFARSWLSNKGCHELKSTFVEIPGKYVQDIDTIEDWKKAIKKFKKLK
ncbi:pseudaminic acid cytidylyltransferase [Candidatus Pelagibacter sp.]|nr:pseudaminic acid cytidylyltransferase [Candidatus Pelagibacter sp.]